MALAIDAVCASRSRKIRSHQLTSSTIMLDGDRAGSEAYQIAAVRIMAGKTLMKA